MDYKQIKQTAFQDELNKIAEENHTGRNVALGIGGAATIGAGIAFRRPIGKFVSNAFKGDVGTANRMVSRSAPRQARPMAGQFPATPAGHYPVAPTQAQRAMNAPVFAKAPAAHAVVPAPAPAAVVPRKGVVTRIKEVVTGRQVLQNRGAPTPELMSMGQRVAATPASAYA